RVPVALLLAVTACSGGASPTENELALRGVGSVVVLQRAPRLAGVGDVFQYTSYVPGARLIKLEPPTADGARTTLCCAPSAAMAGADIQSYDVAFDARSIVFSARIGGDDHYGLYVLTLNDKHEAAGPPRQLATNPLHDFVYPVFAPKDRVIFVTNDVVEEG